MFGPDHTFRVRLHRGEVFLVDIAIPNQMHEAVNANPQQVLCIGQR
jgi:hypothetical protein